ncbi:hypothetical protein EDI_165260 [Entamoeba dispar SAW760]|uniref:SMP-LTD domain-containing protein n=1 Tax=Entamoeba dispar (strain ATCC PRA-260 / SAW760) TaxID=370354 RepID=B0EJH2_ENTDS|nr:uncharacterized protein EDI_165260 [Entamoeba dispar SAW760]EDR25294.1 hypothetical protein EDI_165260 [Entamoeba dispar SAW760]|eukprot:EDR25294.1 hypothetical protein EDI_165260 [Entamoeba dispar SAW760]
MIFSFLILCLTIILGLICFVTVTFFLLFKYSPKVPPPIPVTTPLNCPKTNQIPAFVSDWFNNTPLNEVSSLCIIQIESEETSGVLSTDSECINLVISTQLVRIPLKTVQFKNVSFSGRKMSKKNFMRVIGECGPIYKNSDIIQIRFRYAYELEYWDKILNELCELAHNQRSSQMTKNGIGRKQYRLLGEQMIKNEQGLSDSDKHWSSTVNMLLQLLSYPFISNTDLHNLLRNKINKLFALELTQNLSMNLIQIGNNVPYIKSPKVQCSNEPGAITIDGTLDYTGPFGASFVYDFKLLNIKIQLSFYITSLLGDVRVRILKIPSSTLWFSFHELPKIGISYNLRIGNYVCKQLPIIEQYIIEMINSAILEICYSPKMFPIPIPNFSIVDYLKDIGSKVDEKKEIIVEEQQEQIKEVCIVEQPEKKKNFELKSKEIIKNTFQQHIESVQPQKECTNPIPKISQPPIKEENQIKDTPIPHKLINEGKVRIPQSGTIDKTLQPHPIKELDIIFDKEDINRVYNHFINKLDTTKPLNKKQPPALPKKESLIKSSTLKQIPQSTTNLHDKQTPSLPPKQLVEQSKKQLPSLPPKPILKNSTEIISQQQKECPPLPKRDHPTQLITKPTLPPKHDTFIK